MADQKTYDRVEFDDNEVSRALSGLKRVDAPKDFDFKVKARIAQAQPTGFKTGLPLWVKAAAPVGLLIAVGGYIGLQYSYQTADAVAPTVAVVDTAPIAVAAEVKDPIDVVKPTVEPAPAGTRRTDGTTIARTRKPASTKPFGRSIDQAVRISKQLELKDIALGDALSDAGIAGTFDNGTIKVGSSNAKTGVQGGDVIEAVNGKPVASGSTIKGRIAGKTLRIRRAGKLIDVVVKD
jgi:hypothetical protein